MSAINSWFDFLKKRKNPKTMISNTFCFVLGDKSEVLDIDNVDEAKFPEFKKATRYECILEPGDVLFIPGNLFW